MLGPHRSRSHPTHAINPYSTQDLMVDRPNQVWCADVTYIPMQQGFAFLGEILDFSRYVLAGMVSNTQSTAFCIQSLERVFNIHICSEIFNNNQSC